MQRPASLGGSLEGVRRNAWMEGAFGWAAVERMSAKPRRPLAPMIMIDDITGCLELRWLVSR